MPINANDPIDACRNIIRDTAQDIRNIGDLGFARQRKCRTSGLKQHLRSKNKAISFDPNAILAF